ncbi:hypothetical protein [Antribacter gilvus]|uniref:hypothetical protein n=1 Tax=Antribacter gilvus TaxID=2304675 RepID=UPI000F7B8F0A|nr:hypothetical protein [Antribacter gilvus]
MEPDDARSRLAETIGLFREEVRPATREALVEAAVDALVAGLDSPALAELAGLYPDDAWSELGQVADAVVQELDLYVPTGDEVAFVRLRRQIEALLAGSVSARELAAWAHSEYGHEGLDAVQAFVVADDEYDVLEYTSRSSDELDAWVRDQAQAFLDGPQEGQHDDPDREGESTRQPLTVVQGGVEQVWTLTVIERARDHALHLVSPAGADWRAEGGDAWHALRVLRAELEPLGVQLCCQGARPDAHVSDLCGSMAGGRLAYVLPTWRIPRPRDLVDVLAPAPWGKVGTLAQQADYFERWARRRWLRVI